MGALIALIMNCGRRKKMEHEESVYVTFADFRGTVQITVRELVGILMPYIKEALEEDKDGNPGSN